MYDPIILKYAQKMKKKHFKSHQKKDVSHMNINKL